MSHADGTVPKGRGACVGRVSGAALLCRTGTRLRRRRGAGPSRQVRGGGAGSRAQVLSAVSPGAERDPVLGAYALRVLAPPDRARRHFQVRRRGDHDAGRGSRRGAGAGGAPFCRKHRVGEEGALPRPAPDAGGGRGAHAPPLPRRARLAAAAHGLGRAAVPRMAPPPSPPHLLSAAAASRGSLSPVLCPGSVQPGKKVHLPGGTRLSVLTRFAGNPSHVRLLSVQRTGRAASATWAHGLQDRGGRGGALETGFLCEGPSGSSQHLNASLALRCNEPALPAGTLSRL